LLSLCRVGISMAEQLRPPRGLGAVCLPAVRQQTPGNQNPRQGYCYPRIPSRSCYCAPMICVLVLVGSVLPEQSLSDLVSEQVSQGCQYD
jgi:hypothetical protein